MEDSTKQAAMTIEDAINLHAAGFIASASRLALMLQDKTHVNSESKNWNEEFAVLDYHRRMAFVAKNVLAEAERTIKNQKGN